MIGGDEDELLKEGKFMGFPLFISLFLLENSRVRQCIQEHFID